MNTQLEKLFVQYNISHKDQYEIKQIYELLPVEKKNNLLQNFSNLAIKLYKIQEEIHEEREILIGTKVDKIKKIILSQRESNIQKQITSLKDEL